MTLSRSHTIKNNAPAIIVLLMVWIAGIAMAYLHQRSLGFVCFLKLGIIFFSGVLFWIGVLPFIFKGISLVKKLHWTNTGKVVVIVLSGVSILLLNQLMIHEVIGGILRYLFNCNDIQGSILANPIQNNVLANGVIYGFVSFIFWQQPVALNELPESFLIKRGNTHFRIEVEDIIWIQSDRNCITIYTQDGKYVMYSSLTKFASSYLTEKFIQVHRSRIVNKSFIVAVKKEKTGDGQLTLKDGASLRFSRNYNVNL